MQNAITEELKMVLGEYDIEVLGIKNESYKDKKGVWWIQTPQGYRILKKQSNSDKTLEFIIAAIEHLMSKGVNIPEIFQTKKGSKIANISNHYYILSQAIQGKPPSYDKHKELRKIIEALAGFHAASRSFTPPENCKPRIHLGKQRENFQSKKEKLENFYVAEKSKTEHMVFGTTVLENFPYFDNRIRMAIEELEGSAYGQWVSDTESTAVGLCHQDFAAGNLLLTDSGSIYVLDMDSVTIDIPIRDIRKILNKVMKKRGGWDISLTKDMLTWYQEKNALVYSQWQVLKAELIYPHLFEGIMSKYYEVREKSWTQEKYLKRLEEMIIMEKSVECIIKDFDTIIPE